MKKILSLILMVSISFFIISCGNSSNIDTVNAQPNKAPTASAGNDISANVGDTINLNGSGSTDSDGNITSYEWFEGNTSLGTGMTFATTTLAQGEHTITLQVTDDDGAVGRDGVKVTINPVAQNKVPTANAGADQSQTEGTTIILDGSSSSDSDGTIVKYEWYEGATLLGSGETLLKNDFTVGSHTVQLTVTDDDGGTNSDTAIITISAAQDTTPPTATITPSNGTKDVSIDSNITISFSEAMNTSTLVKANFSLIQGGSDVNYTLTSNTSSVTINPTSDFANSTSYTVTAQNATDVAGNVMALTTSTFTTKAPSSTTLPPVKSIVFKTGQTSSYDASGAVSTTILDDGHYKKGVAKNYERSNNIVTDKETGLIWQDDTAVTTKVKSADISGYCGTVTLGGHTDWRLPTRKELGSLINYSPTASHAMPSEFLNVATSSGDFYATSTSYNASNMYAIRFDTGREQYQPTASSKYVRCVRGNTMSNNTCQQLGITPLVGCTDGSLLWRNDVPTTASSWEDAISYCEGLTEFSGGWRLPNIAELKSIIDDNSTTHVNSAFNNANSDKQFWSSTSHAPSSTANFAWTITFSNGQSVTANKNSSTKHYVLCVGDSRPI